MKTKIVNTQASHLMEMIREQSDTVLSYEGKIPQIELDILLENVRKLYDALKELEKLNASADAREVEEAKPVIESPKTEPVVMELIPVVEEPVAVAVEPEKEHHQPEELLAAFETPVQASPAQITSEEVLPQAVLAQDKNKPAAKSATLFDEDVPTLADKFTSAPSLHDRFAAATQDDSISARIKSNPIGDLKKAIGINEKFALINELFEGDINAYNESIEALNTAPDEAQALTYLNQTLASKYGWDQRGEAFMKLRGLVERRY
ncbi:MAG: hypothetical protein ACKPB3_01480 [Bacteroidota bacterium]